jgi:hypothetical protein
VATAVPAVSVNIQSAAARLDMPIMGIHPCRFRRKPSF